MSKLSLIVVVLACYGCSSGSDFVPLVCLQPEEVPEGGVYDLFNCPAGLIEDCEGGAYRWECQEVVRPGPPDPGELERPLIVRAERVPLNIYEVPSCNGGIPSCAPTDRQPICVRHAVQELVDMIEEEWERLGDRANLPENRDNPRLRYPCWRDDDGNIVTNPFLADYHLR